MRERVDLKSPVRENRPPGSVRGAPGDRRPYVRTTVNETTGESPSPTEARNGRVSERNCVAKRPGGKQREENCSAQSIIPMKLNSIRPSHWKSLRRKGEIDLLRKGSVTPPQRVKAEIIGSVEGGWSERGRKVH